MDDLALFIKYDEYREAEMPAVIQSLRQCCCLLCLCRMILDRLKIWFLIIVLTIYGTAGFASCSSNEDNGKVAEIVGRGTILFGTTGDYRPLSFCEPDGTYWGFDIDVAKEIAKRIGVGVDFRKTSWPTLTADVLAEGTGGSLADGEHCYPSDEVRRFPSETA